MRPERAPIKESESRSDTARDDEGASSDDDPGDPDTELNQHLWSLKHTVDNLYKLSFLIRNSTSRQTALQKAESYGKNFDGHGTDRFAHLDVDHQNRASEFLRQVRMDSGCKHDQRSASDDATLLNQLSQASSKRQRKFAYWDQHSKKLSAEGIDSVSGSPGIDQTFDAARHITGPVTIASCTEATLYQAIENDVQSVAASASTARGLDGTRVPMPKAPRLIEGQTEFECPYCYVWCPASERQRWR